MKPFPLTVLIIGNALLLAGSALVGDGPVAYCLLAVSFLCTTGFLLWTKNSVETTCAQVSETFAAMTSNKFDCFLTDNALLQVAALRETILPHEVALKTRLSRDEAMLANIITPMAIIDEKGNISWLNEYMVRLTENDGTPQQYIGKHFSQFFYGDSRETIGETAIRSRQKQSSKTEFDTRKGHHKFISMFATPIMDFDNKLIGGFISVADFTGVVLKERTITEQNHRIANGVKEATAVAESLAEAAEHMTAQISQSTQGMEEQRARTTEVAAAIEEMNATILEVARNAGDAAATAGQANSMASTGANLVDQVINVMESVNTKATSLKSEMRDLGEQAQGIGQIMQVISDIADQTNLLALNAAIEAARAGEAGRGFAVVADEVRKLAEKTMTATKEVSSFIRAIQDSAGRNIAATDETTHVIEQADTLAHDAGDALRQILNFVERTSDQVRGIATAAEQQSATSEEINRSTDHINTIAESTAGAMAVASSAVSNLAHLASDLRTSMTRMHLDE
ncbi:methyl-accepting chemotaxis protein [Desulfovibrio sp. TomC]|uniref:methyl-accepting chemotaxis protein n=1 Tax=Desulfovibrio sp. TomC TaxID=1562888 RepID=UPI0005BA18D3|nr:methyl-accepting chemotaxis protein [Desulfovibrio sp. TomC]